MMIVKYNKDNNLDRVAKIRNGQSQRGANPCITKKAKHPCTCSNPSDNKKPRSMSENMSKLRKRLFVKSQGGK